MGAREVKVERDPVPDTLERSGQQTATGITVVIPCLDEEQAIGIVIEDARKGVRACGLPAEIIVVDNGCTDRTAQVATQHGARVIVEPRRGYGSALRAGLGSARHGVLVMADGDSTYSLLQLPELVRPILAGEADFVMGMRQVQPGAMSFSHHYIGNPALTAALRVLFRCDKVHDAHCGIRAISKDAFERLKCVTTGMEFASEMIVRAIEQRMRIAERPVPYKPRIGQSKLRTFADGWRHLRFLVLHSPTRALVVPGVAIGVLGILVALTLTFGPILVRGRSIGIHTMLMSGLLNVLSLQLVSAGIIAKVHAHLCGLRRDSAVGRIIKSFTFERALIGSSMLMVPGILGIGYVVVRWIVSGFGDLDKGLPLFFSILCLVDGIQIAAVGYVMSIMSLPRADAT